MRIAIDMDGTITEGRYLYPPRTRSAYMSLKPYDNDTIDVLYDLMHKHEIYIITARSEPRADRMIQDWLSSYNLHPNHPTAILTNVQQPDKFRLAWDLKCNLMFDDSPTVYHDAWRYYTDDSFTTYPYLFLMDNKNWDKNQVIDTKFRLNSWKAINDICNDSESYQLTSTV